MEAEADIELPPRPMMGIEFRGMLISAVHKENDEEKLHLLMPDNHIPAGAKIYEIIWNKPLPNFGQGFCAPDVQAPFVQNFRRVTN